LDNPKPAASSDQRPYHICPECNAYNAKFNASCWRCSHDMTAEAVSPSGVLGYRLEKLDDEAKAKPPEKS
jgi:ribosomal protein L40E